MSKLRENVFPLFSSRPLFNYVECKAHKLTHSLTEVVDGVARLMKGPRIKLEADDGENENGEHDEQSNLHKRRQRLQYGL